MEKLHEFKKLIEEKYGTQVAFAHIAGISPANLNNKIARKTTFSSTQIERYAKLLDIRRSQIGRVFFPELR